MIWYLKQLLPLRYKGTYHAEQMSRQFRGDLGIKPAGPVTLSWWMWFGRVFWLRPQKG